MIARLARVGRLATHDRGASAVEYGLIAVAVAVVIAVLVFTLGQRVRGTYVDTCTQWNAADPSASTSC